MGLHSRLMIVLRPSPVHNHPDVSFVGHYFRSSFLEFPFLALQFGVLAIAVVVVVRAAEDDAARE